MSRACSRDRPRLDALEEGPGRRRRPSPRGGSPASSGGSARDSGSSSAPGHVLLAADDVGEDGGEQIGRPASAAPRGPPASRPGRLGTASARVAFQRQRVGEERRVEDGLLDGVLEVPRGDVAERLRQREGVLRAQREQDSRRRRRRPAARSRRRRRSACAARAPRRGLMRWPNGACTTSCIPPDSSKKRSKTTSSSVGTSPMPSRVARR